MIKRTLNKDVSVDKLRLQASERNEDWSDKLFYEFKNSLLQSDIKFYPNLNNLYSKLKEHYRVDNLILGTGSDKCIEYFIQAHRDTHKKLIIFDPCFPMYFVYGEVYGYEVVKIKQESLDIPYREFISQIDKDSIVIITNPTSPMGQILDYEFVDQVLATGVPVLIDEAYIEFSDESTFTWYIESFSNLYVTRTFSKALGSAGIRLGVIASSKHNIDKLQQFRPMFEINTFTVKWAELLIQNMDEVGSYINKVKEVRKQVIEKCNLKNIPCIGGNSNWIHIIKDDLPEDIIFKTNCKVPGDDRDWVRLQITTNINDYLWL